MPCRGCITIAAGLVAMTAALPGSAGAITNVVTDLGTLGGSYSFAAGVNDSGQVAGTSRTSGGDDRAFLHSGGTMVDLGTLGGSYSHGHAINASGAVAGAAALAGSAGSHATVWSGGSPVDLGTLGGEYSTAYDINNAGDVVGVAYTTGNFTFRPFLFSGGVMTDLGTFGGSLGSAYGINAVGQVTGEAATAVSGRHAFLWTAGVMTDLGVLAGSSSYGDDVNAGGDVVGVSSSSPFLSTGGTMFALGTPPSFATWPRAINDAGHIVGTSFSPGGGIEFQRAFISNGGLHTDLNRLLPAGSGWALRSAEDISNAGHIVGWGNLAGDPTERAFLLTLGVGCGNGLVEAGEDCDDTNATAGDGCSPMCAEESPWHCDGQPSVCRVTDSPIDAVKILLKRTSSGDKLAFSSKDPAVLFPAPGGGDDPTVVGGAVDLFSDSEWTATYDLPATNWETSPTGLVQKFVNPTAPDAMSAVKVVRIRQGATLKVVAKAIGLHLSDPQMGVAVRVRIGSQWTCARFGPATVVRDEQGAFVARFAAASSIADCSEASLH